MHFVSSSSGLVVVLACGLVSLTAERADACSCIEPGIAQTIPEDGATDVVRDARIFLTVDSQLDEARTILVDDAGTEVFITIARLEFLQYVVTVVTPSEPLAPNTHYTLRDREEDSWEFVQFTTGERVDDGPPAKPGVEVERTWSYHSIQGPCGSEEHGASFTLDSPDAAPIVLASKDGAPQHFDAATLEGHVTDLTDRGGSVVLGSGFCNNAWPDAEGGASATFVFALVDRAGNVSEWSDPVDVTLPPTTPTCSHVDVTHTSSPHALLAALTALVVCLRRRRRCLRHR